VIPPFWPEVQYQNMLYKNHTANESMHQEAAIVLFVPSFDQPTCNLHVILTCIDRTYSYFNFQQVHLNYILSHSVFLNTVNKHGSNSTITIAQQYFVFYAPKTHVRHWMFITSTVFGLGMENFFKARGSFRSI